MARPMLSELDEVVDEGFVKGMKLNWEAQAEAQIEESRAKIAAIKSQANLGPIEHCLDRFVRAELDTSTPGQRGIGRVSLSPPRLGGYFRRQLSRLSERDLSELGDLMRCLLFRGYLIRALTEKTFDPTTGQVEGERLFDQWITRIYATNFAKGVLVRIYYFGENPLTRLKEFLVSKNAVGGGIFSKDKSEAIILWYLLAGFLLRQEEGMAASLD